MDRCRSIHWHSATGK